MEGICDYCGYLIKDYSNDNKTDYIACCGKCWTDNLPKVISRAMKAGESVISPNWCHKLGGEKKEETPSPQYVTPTKGKFDDLPTHLLWEDIEVGETYVIPPIMYQKLRVVKTEYKSDYCIRCLNLDKNLNPDGTVYNIYRKDKDMIFIVKYHQH